MKLYSSTLNSNNIHNLSSVSHIPVKFKCLLNLGLKFCLGGQVTKREVDNALSEACRKIAWKVHFKINGKESKLTNLQKWYVTFRKEYRNVNKVQSQTAPWKTNFLIIKRC